MAITCIDSHLPGDGPSHRIEASARPRAAELGGRERVSVVSA